MAGPEDVTPATFPAASAPTAVSGGDDASVRSQRVSPPCGHDPQWSVPPQPSLASPQDFPSDAQVPGTQVPGPPQTFGVPPPPQVWP
jgi:hypothetical protein